MVKGEKMEEGLADTSFHQSPPTLHFDAVCARIFSFIRKAARDKSGLEKIVRKMRSAKGFVPERSLLGFAEA